ncbi:hypothetical protein ACIQF6_23065 [Kitasatospora sp. NPDC092948]|uniref:Imm32 family immunity protein n=1 Tax=Kitasatospora sp. NPDC092948 TaxID=3364088 RepID=UPI0037FF74EE
MLLKVDAGRRVPVIGGDTAGREALAGELRAMASMADGGHLHLDHYPGHWPAEGSVALVINSPHGEMPRR